MKITQLTESPEGPVTFEAELSQDQAKFLIGVGINFLIRSGADVFRTISKAQDSKLVVPGSNTVQ